MSHYRCFACQGANLYGYQLRQTLPDTNQEVVLNTLRCKDCLVEAPISTWATLLALQKREQAKNVHFDDWRLRATQWLLKKVADEKTRTATNGKGQTLDERTLRYLINELNTQSSTLWKR